MELQARSYIHIQRPVSEVFDAVRDPRKLEQFFVTEASAPLEAGSTVRWVWGDMKAGADVMVIEVVRNEKITIRWEGGENMETMVTLTFAEVEKGTRVEVVEDGWPKTVEGIHSYGNNMQGWANFLVCLKAFVEHGINLRKGAF